jgi:hypothetical protein
MTHVPSIATLRLICPKAGPLCADNATSNSANNMDLSHDVTDPAGFILCLYVRFTLSVDDRHSAKLIAAFRRHAVHLLLNRADIRVVQTVTFLSPALRSDDGDRGIVHQQRARKLPAVCL